MSDLGAYDFTPRGWVCPICGRVYCPTTPMCFSCGNNQTSGGDSTKEMHYYDSEGNRIKSV